MEYLINTNGVMDSFYAVGGKETLQLLRKRFELIFEAFSFKIPWFRKNSSPVF